MSKFKRILVILLSFVLLGLGAPARADMSEQNSRSGVNVSIPATSHRESLQLLLAGQGRLAAENPELVTALGFDPNRPSISEEKLNSIISGYLEFSDSYHEIYSKVTSGDPASVYQGLIDFTE